MSTKKTASKKTATTPKAKAQKGAAKPKIKTVEDTPDGVVEAPPAKDVKTKGKKAPPADKKLSALDAAAKVLADAKEPLGAKQMIEAMTAKGYWTSPGGKTPHATLYSAILREITTKGKDARFAKTERGRFALQA